jgi:hypothetical protein
MIKINGAEPKGFRINGSEVKKLIYNGQIVWEGWSPYGNIAPEHGSTIRTALIDDNINTYFSFTSTISLVSIAFDAVNLCDQVEILASGTEVIVSVHFSDGTSTSQTFALDSTKRAYTMSFDEKQVANVQLKVDRGKSCRAYEFYLYGKVKL